MKKITLVICALMVIFCVSGVNAAEADVSFTADTVEINVGRRLDLGSMLSVAPEDSLTEITYFVSDSTVGEIIDGKFVTKRTGTAVITAVASFGVEGETVTDYDTLSIAVNPEGDAVKTYDTNLDGIINSEDLSAVLSAYGTYDASCDFNDDGVVNSSDLSLILNNYGVEL